MDLSPERAGPYVRALAATLSALAPDESFVPLSSALAHLGALDPSISGDVLAPAEVSRRTGMPAWAWLDRARAEAVLAARGSDPTDPTDADLAHAASLDAALGRRMRDRRDLHRHLRHVELLPTLRLVGVLRTLRPRVGIAYDRISPDGRWVRVRAELDAPTALAEPGEGTVALDEGLEHLLTRHFADPLPALLAQLRHATGAEVARVSRGWVGPFWFPGVDLPDGVPAELGVGLLLHTSLEVVGPEVRARRDLDPLEPPDGMALPAGCGSVRERRFAGVGPVVEAARRWTGGRCLVVSVVPERPRRL